MNCLPGILRGDGTAVVKVSKEISRAQRIHNIHFILNGGSVVDPAVGSFTSINSNFYVTNMNMNTLTISSYQLFFTHLKLASENIGIKLEKKTKILFIYKFYKYLLDLSTTTLSFNCRTIFCLIFNSQQRKTKNNKTR